MKHLTLLFLFIGLTFISASPQQDVKKDTVVVNIKSKDTHTINVAVGKITRHMDSINHFNAVDRHSKAVASEQRDSAMIEMLGMSLENDRLRDANLTLKSQTKTSHDMSLYIYLLLLMIAGSLIAKGIFEGIAKYMKERKNDI